MRVKPQLTRYIGTAGEVADAEGGSVQGMRRDHPRPGRNHARHMDRGRLSIGLDYSGAVTPESRYKGIRVYVTEGCGTPENSAPFDCRA
jgi:hypothetical protein